MAEESSIWFRIGYALESARRASPATLLGGLREGGDEGGAPTKHGSERGVRQRPAPLPPVSRNGAVGAWLGPGSGIVAGALLKAVPGRGKPGVKALVRAAAAGAGAALLREVADPLLRGQARLARLDARSIEAVFAGAARGLVYGALMEPRLPGPAAVRGVLYGSVEYALSPLGGLPTLLGKHAPHRRIPLSRDLVQSYALGDDRFVDHLVFALTLALCYGSQTSGSSNGTDEDT